MERNYAMMNIIELRKALKDRTMITKAELLEIMNNKVVRNAIYSDYDQYTIRLVDGSEFYLAIG